MIVSVGVDMIEVERIKRALEDARLGRRFRDRVYTDKEVRYCERKGRGKYQSYAGRFAAKEAIMKALGRGWGSSVGWSDIEVLPARGGRPEVCLHRKTSALARELGIQNFSLSITHTQDYAMAYVIAQSET
jgi:holo-[acyl-carrier protein] synthase